MTIHGDQRRTRLKRSARTFALVLLLFGAGFLIGGQLSKMTRQAEVAGAMTGPFTGMAMDLAVALVILDTAIDRVADRR